ncbi:MAG: squalene/phytoene synthase family protein [Pirellulales bacterium]|nr:squalene/phytoene synthase family protein [Pirellulales bacterium]
MKTLEESYTHCREIIRRSHSNFLLAFLLLPPMQRRAMEAIYAFMRYADDVVDERQTLDTAGISDATANNRRGGLDFCRWLLVDIYRTTLRDSSFENAIVHPKEFPKKTASIGKSISPALIDSIERFQIPYEYFVALLDGVEMDLTKTHYQTFAELEFYCERVASAVGLACIHIWGFEGRGTPAEKEVYELARKVGIAYQLTNILRDLKEDAAMGRVYLPLDEISAAGYSAEELIGGGVNAAFEKLMQCQIDRAEDYYRASRELYVRLMPEGKKIFGLMTTTYHAILKRIAANPAAIFTRRIRPGKLDSSLLFAQWFFSAPPKELLF